MTSKDIFHGLKPAALWNHFARITEIPRPSGQEAAVRDWIAEWAESHGFTSRQDAAGNLCVYVPATPGLTAAPTVAFQTHLDMVCVRASNAASDPAQGRIEIVREGDWIAAPDSTLGADNGIGMAAAMCLAQSRDVPHGPLELLFTVEEETTFKGAEELDPGLVRARVMLNLDSEAMGTLLIGSAGCIETATRWPAADQAIPDGWRAAKIVLSGLTGGHSGLDIPKNHLNAIKGMVWILRGLAKELPFRLCALEGGDAFNAIPVWTHATVAFPPGETPRIEAALEEACARLVERYASAEPGLSLTMLSLEGQSLRCWSDEKRNALLDLLTMIPSGALAVELHDPHLVETSNNLGYVKMEGETLKISCLARSSVAEAQEQVAVTIETAARLTGAAFAIVPPNTAPWRLPLDSALLALVQRVYRDLFSQEPAVATMHGVVECGTIQQRIPGLDVLSVGPDIERVHRPGERVSISSVAAFYGFLCEIVMRLGNGPGTAS